MEVIWLILTCIFTGFAVYFFVKRNYENEMEKLAADCSQKVQTVYRELAIVCTENNTMRSDEIKLRVRLNLEAQGLILNKEENV